MKSFLALLTTISMSASLYAQNVGIGTATPESLLHLKTTTDSTLVTVESSAPLVNGKNIGMVFKMGPYYTAGMRSIVTNTPVARLGFFSGTTANINSLIERLSITNDGNIGINTTTPFYKLEVNGNGYFQNIIGSPTMPALKGYSAQDSRFAPGVVGTGASIGVLGNSNTINGIGIYGYNNINNASIPYFPGSGVQGFSSLGYGVVGISSTPGYSGIHGISTTPGIAGASFTGVNGAHALTTSGLLRFSGNGEAQGKVLTSDANGNASWQDPGATGKIFFSAYQNHDYVVFNDSVHNFRSLVVEYSQGNNFDAVEGIFTAPSDGLYEFNCSISFFIPNNSTIPVYSVVAFKKNAIPVVGGSFNHTSTVLPGEWIQTVSYSKKMILVAGDQVALQYNISQNGSPHLYIRGGLVMHSSTFSGVKL